MAEDFETSEDSLDADAAGQTDPGERQDAEGQESGTPDTDAHPFGEVPPDPSDPQYKYWQAAYTKTRQKDRERFGTLEAEHKQFGDVLRQFYQSDEFALQTLRNRFPHLASRLNTDGDTRAPGQSHQASQGQTSPVVQMLEQRLGDNLAFLAPSLGPVIEEVVRALTQEAVTPLKRQSDAQAAQQRKREEDRLMGEIDAEFPGWEGRYGTDMKALEAFLASEELSHPKFGSRYKLLMQALNPDLARIDAAREMDRASRGRVTTGRTGRPAQPSIAQDITKAKTNADAFALAAQAAMRELNGR